MPFVKLDCGILDSTIWVDREAREIFITALLMARPKQTTVPLNQIGIRALEPTGFVVPPGSYGWIAASGPGIIRRAGIENMEVGLAALERLGSPELDSRTPDFEGRRLIRVDGGYVALNYMRYRDKDYTAAERMRRWRGKSKSRARKTPSQEYQARHVLSAASADEQDFVRADGDGDLARADEIAARAARRIENGAS